MPLLLAGSWSEAVLLVTTNLARKGAEAGTGSWEVGKLGEVEIETVRNSFAPRVLRLQLLKLLRAYNCCQLLLLTAMA